MPDADRLDVMLSANNPSFDERWNRLYDHAIAEATARRQAETDTEPSPEEDISLVIDNSILSSAVSIKPIQEALF